MSILSGERLTSWLRLDWFRLPPVAGRRGFRGSGMLVGDGWDCECDCCDCEGALEPPSSGDNSLLMSILASWYRWKCGSGQPYGYLKKRAQQITRITPKTAGGRADAALLRRTAGDAVMGDGLEARKKRCSAVVFNGAQDRCK